MGFKVVKIAAFYPEAIADACRKGLIDPWAPSDVQFRQIMDFSFSWADHHTRAFRQLGHEADDVIFGVACLYEQYRRERGASKTDRQILFELLEEKNPEVLLIQEPFVFSDDDLKEMKSRLPRLKMMIGAHCAPYEDSRLQHLEFFDLMMTCSPGFVDAFRAAGLKTVLVPHAFAPDLLERLPKIPYREREVDFLFTGSLMGGRGFHQQRIAFLEDMVKRSTQIRILSGSPLGTGWKKTVKEAALAFSGITGFENEKIRSWKASRWSTTLKNVVRPPVYGIEMFEAIARSKIAFNVHAEVAGDYAANVRLFEVTGAGAVLLTDEKKNIRDYFEPGREILTFRTLEEAREKVKWALNHPAEAEAIAKRGQERCLRDHSYLRRAEILSEQIQKMLS